MEKDASMQQVNKPLVERVADDARAKGGPSVSTSSKGKWLSTRDCG